MTLQEYYDKSCREDPPKQFPPKNPKISLDALPDGKTGCSAKRILAIPEYLAFLPISSLYEIYHRSFKVERTYCKANSIAQAKANGTFNPDYKEGQ
ncbi:hypothetical protein HYX16_02975 [Candidatus Woesearchaeota archaeon]|nr:hypothetical protein [Candidatus Woesearchaeota archaeon]